MKTLLSSLIKKLYTPIGHPISKTLCSLFNTASLQTIDYFLKGKKECTIARLNAPGIPRLCSSAIRCKLFFANIDSSRKSEPTSRNAYLLVAHELLELRVPRLFESVYGRKWMQEL